MENSLADLNNDTGAISVVLAVYNGEKYLRKLLDSVLGQQDVFIKELIIVDDKSDDSSAEIIKGYQRQNGNIKIINNEVNIGPIGSFIKGAGSASSGYIAFADQDDIWLDNKLRLSLERLKKINNGDKPAVVFTDLEMIDEEDRPMHTSFWKLYNIKPAENNFYTVLFGNMATGCTMLINRKMLDEFVTMPPEAPMHDHWIALIALSFGNWDYLDQPTVLYRVHQNSVTNKSEITFGKKLNNFLKASFSKSPVFLNDYLGQALLFKSRYATMLNEQQNRWLDHFIKLKNASGFIKKLNSKFRFSLYKRI